MGGMDINIHNLTPTTDISPLLVVMVFPVLHGLWIGGETTPLYLCVNQPSLDRHHDRFRNHCDQVGRMYLDKWHKCLHPKTWLIKCVA